MNTNSNTNSYGNSYGNSTSTKQFWRPNLVDRTTNEGLDGNTLLSFANSSSASSSSRHASIAKQRLLLPIYQYRHHILYALEQHSIVILVSETGTGKSTQIPQYLYEAGWAQGGHCIACTQPRRIAAITIANRAALEMQVEVGRVVGYSIRFDQQCSEQTAIKYCTDGVLLRETLSDPLLSKYSVIMVDEAHERSLHSDILLGLLKKIKRKRPDLRLIITSATMDAAAFKAFFDLSYHVKSTDSSDVAIMQIPGRMHPVDLFYLTHPTKNYLEKTVETILEIHRREDAGDILAFLPGGEDIDTVIHWIQERHPGSDLHCLPLYSTLPYQMQMQVFFPAQSGVRKVVVATNIAETSITIDGIRFVVDCGFVKQSYFDSSNGIDCLLTCPISQAAATQRAGRAGRVREGKCFRLMTEPGFRALAEHSPPEMQRSDITTAVLQLKALGIDDIAHFDFLSPPPVESMLHALDLLFSLGALDDKCKLTGVGEKIAEMPVDPRLAKCLLSSLNMGCSEEILSIAAMCSVDFPFIQPRGVDLSSLSSSSATNGGDSSTAGGRSALAKQRLLECMGSFTSTDGDHLTLLNVYRGYEASGSGGALSWCDSMCLQHRVLVRATEIRKQLLGLLRRYKDEGVVLASCFDDTETIRRCIINGYFSNIAQLASSGDYVTVRGKARVQVHYTSVFSRFGAPPEWVVYHDIVQSTIPMMRDVTRINPVWALLEAKHYYTPDSKIIPDQI